MRNLIDALKRIPRRTQLYLGVIALGCSGLIASSGFSEAPQDHSSVDNLLSDFVSELEKGHIRPGQFEYEAQVDGPHLYWRISRTDDVCSTQAFLEKDTYYRVNLCDIPSHGGLIVRDFSGGQSLDIVKERRFGLSAILSSQPIPKPITSLKELESISKPEDTIVEYYNFCSGKAVLTSYRSHLLLLNSAEGMASSISQLQTEVCQKERSQ